jgi:hypothetical protein
MNTLLANVLKTTIAFGGVGAVIDFLIGKGGQTKVKDWLEIQWYRFSDIKWNNFEQKEAKLSISLMDKICGPTLFCVRRLISSLLLVFTIFVVTTIVMMWKQVTTDISVLSVKYYVIGLVTLSIDTVVFGISVSLTRQISVICEASCRLYKRYNLLLFTVLLLIHYSLLVIWGPIVRTLTEVPWSWGFGWVSVYLVNLKDELLNQELYIPGNFIDRVYRDYRAHSLEPMGAYNASRDSINYVANVWRILIAIIFASSYVLSRLLKPLSLLWARIVESDKPVFTLIFGGAAGAASLAQEIWNHM